MDVKLKLGPITCDSKRNEHVRSQGHRYALAYARNRVVTLASGFTAQMDYLL